MFSLLRKQKILLVGLAFTALSFTHIPVAIFPHIFDKNIAPQFVVLTLLAGIYGIYIVIHGEKFRVHRLVRWSLYALVAVVLISALLSGNIVTSLTGDTGRYAGAITLFSLVIVAIFHSQFTFAQLRKLVTIYVSTSGAMAIVGVLQHFQVIELPGDQGVVGTLGNLDFYAAYIGISMPLYLFLAIGSSLRVRLVLLASVLFSFYSLILATPLQAFVDIAITLFGALIYLLRKRIPRFDWSLNVRTFLGTFAVVIWAEVIFLTPFIGSWIPVLGNDVQVKIRSNFWLAGMNGFFSQPFFGLGPDQYGNYYEKFRTLEDARTYEKILSNDAHSSSVQTLATLGIFGTIAILFLVALFIRALLITFDRNPEKRSWIFALGLLLSVFLTNSFISPITPPTKYLMWAIGGWVVGQVYRNTELRNFSIRPIVALLSGAALFVGANVAVSQVKYSQAFEKYAQDQNAKVDYTFSPFIPCFMYLEAEFQMVKSQGIDAVYKLASDQVGANPRCVSARILLAQIYEGRGDIANLKEQIYQLVEIAPTRTEIIRMGMSYANKNSDTYLLGILEKQMRALGLIYVPGTEG